MLNVYLFGPNSGPTYVLVDRLTYYLFFECYQNIRILIVRYFFAKLSSFTSKWIIEDILTFFEK